MRALRLTLLALFARVLRRWLNAVTAQLVPAADSLVTPDSPVPANDAVQAGQPTPPDHWVELVRQHAPQLLEPDSADQSRVIEWRSDDPLTPPQVVTWARNARPLRLQMPLQRPPVAPPTVKSAPRRPLRLEQVTAQPLDAAEIGAHSSEIALEEIKPPVRAAQASDSVPRPTSVTIPHEAEAVVPPIRASHPIESAPRPKPAAIPDEAEAVLPPQRRPSSADVPEPFPRTAANFPDEAEAVTSHYAHLPFERQVIRETQTALPRPPDVPTIRTAANPAGALRPRPTSAPPAPPQVVLRPMLTGAPLDIEEISADRWPSLPDEPAEEAPSRLVEQQRRERLHRAQEGRRWSE